MAAFTSLASVLSVILLLFPISEATDYVVGGTVDAWRIPTKTDALNEWAEKIDFVVGDYLVWTFINGDSALEVEEEDYVNCNTEHPQAQYQGENNKALLSQNGSFYYISGTQGHCQMGQKLNITVGASIEVNPGPTISPEVHVGAAALESSKGSALAPTVTAMQAGFLLFALGMLAMVR